jgi:hypothetical protein
MELTEKELTARLNQIIGFQTNDEHWGTIKENLREKGVECAIIVPILDVLLNFNPLTDIEYEVTNPMVNGQRFDFVLIGKIVIEVKRIEEALPDHYQQITDYLVKSDKECGILTNGYEFWVILTENYIRRIANEGQKVENLGNKKAIRVMRFSIDALEKGNCEFFSKFIKYFSKEKIEDNLKKIAWYALSVLVGRRGPYLDDDKEINKFIQDNIRENCTINKGSYFEEVKNGTYEIGQELYFEDTAVDLKIKVIVQEFGLIKLPKDGIVIGDFTKLQESKEYANLFTLLAEKWNLKEEIYSDYKEIFKKITGKNKIYEKYHFSP